MSPIRNWRIRHQLVTLVAVGPVGWISEAVSAPITFNTALPVAKGETRI